MHEALMLIARAIALAHDRWRARVGTRRPLSGKIAVLEELVQRLEAENALLRARFLRLPARRRPRYRPHERLEILWHAARHRLSGTATAHAFGLSRQTVINWRRITKRKNPPLLSPMKGLSGLIHELIHRLKRECAHSTMCRRRSPRSDRKSGAIRMSTVMGRYSWSKIGR
jgi:transposase-like protein